MLGDVMKSQDIPLLLKLVALERLAHAPGTALGEPPEDLTVEIASDSCAELSCRGGPPASCRGNRPGPRRSGRFPSP